MWRACAGSRAQIPGGWSTRHPATPLVRQLNAVRLRACPSADELQAIAERQQADLRFRHVVIEQSVAAERLAPELEARGWLRERVVLMTREDDAGPPPVDPRAREIDEPALVALERRIFVQENVGPGAHPELPRQLSDAQAALRAATEVRRLAAGDGDELAAMATVYLDPDVGGMRVALVESVGTLRPWREQGLGTAVMGAALRAAGAWGAQLTAIVTDADDWPQVWYAGLGFAPRRRHVGFVALGDGWGSGSGGSAV